MAAIGELLAAPQAVVAAQVLEGALLEIYAGPRPDRFGGRKAGPLLVTFLLAGMQAQGAVVASGKLEGNATGSGEPTWYRVTAAMGVLIEGGADDFGFVKGSSYIAQHALVTLDQFRYFVNKGA